MNERVANALVPGVHVVQVHGYDGCLVGCLVSYVSKIF